MNKIQKKVILKYMNDNYHTKADLSDYIDRETKLITPFFRLTKITGLVSSTLLILSYIYSVIKLIILGIKLDDPFADFSFSFPFIVLLIELDCLICLFPAFFKKEYSLLKFILIMLSISSLVNADYITAIISIWLFISITLLIPATDRARLKYDEYCSNLRSSKSKEETYIFTNPELTTSIDAQNGYAPPIDNANLFKKKSIFDEEIDLVDMKNVFKTKKDSE